jgi:hypothetical protein
MLRLSAPDDRGNTRAFDFAAFGHAEFDGVFESVIETTVCRSWSMTSFELLVLHERRSPSGRLYLSGKLNDATVIIYLDEDADVPEGATANLAHAPTPRSFGAHDRIRSADTRAGDRIGVAGEHRGSRQYGRLRFAVHDSSVMDLLEVSNV